MTLFSQFIWQQSSVQVEGASSRRLQTCSLCSTISSVIGVTVVQRWYHAGSPWAAMCQKRCGTVGLWDTDSYSCCRWTVSQPFVVKFKEKKRNLTLETMKYPLQPMFMLYIFIFDGFFFHTSPIPSKLCCRFLSWFGPLVDQSQFTLFWHRAICIWNFGGLHGSVFVLVENSSLYANTYAHLWMKN